LRVELKSEKVMFWDFVEDNGFCVVEI
jgi:hypothetical protein